MTYVLASVAVLILLNVAWSWVERGQPDPWEPEA